jgi:hypothetical protein
VEFEENKQREGMHIYRDTQSFRNKNKLLAPLICAVMILGASDIARRLPTWRSRA